MSETKIFSGEKRLIAAIFVASFFTNMLVLTAPLYMLQLFSRIMSSGSKSTLLVLTAGALIALVFYFLFDALRQRLATRLGNRLEAKHGQTVISILVQAASATDKRGGQPVRDLHEIRAFVTSPAFMALLDSPWSILFVGIIFMFHASLGWIALAGVLILFALGVLNEIFGRNPSANASAVGQQANALVEEMVRNADVVRAMGKSPALVQRWERRSFASLSAAGQVVDRVAVISSLAKFVRMVLQIAILGFGVLLVLDGLITPGVMIATSILLGRAAAPIEQSIAGWRAMMSARQAHKRLNLLLASVEQGQRPMPLPEPKGMLSVENATVVVPEHQNPLIFDINFELRPGDSLGIIGPSGSGKTTLSRAIVGLQPLSRGYIRMDNTALTDWPADQIGEYIGFLPQRVELFDGTIADNIAMMDEDASPAEVVAAAKKSNTHDLIVSMPGGYNASVGLRGELLSAGQRQRIAMARAFYGDKRLIVLDEPNANLDPDGEEALAKALEQAKKDGTVVIVITHRKSVLRNVTHAAMMQDGRMVRFGKARTILEAAAKPVSPHVVNDPKVTPIEGRVRRREAQDAERSTVS